MPWRTPWLAKSRGHFSAPGAAAAIVASQRRVGSPYVRGRRGLSASHVRPWLGSQVPWSWKKGRPRASAQAARAMMSDVPPVFGRWMKDTTPWSTSGGRRQARS